MRSFMSCNSKVKLPREKNIGAQPPPAALILLDYSLFKSAILASTALLNPDTFSGE